MKLQKNKQVSEIWKLKNSNTVYCYEVEYLFFWQFVMGNPLHKR